MVFHILNTIMTFADCGIKYITDLIISTSDINVKISIL